MSEVDRQLHTEDQMRKNSSLDDGTDYASIPTELGNGSSLSFVAADEVKDVNEATKKQADVP